MPRLQEGRASKREDANLGMSVCSSIPKKAGGEPKKRNSSVAVAKTLEITQAEGDITSLKFTAKRDLQHAVSGNSAEIHLTAGWKVNCG